MNHLLIVFVVLAVLLVLYLVARKIKPLGQSVAFVAVVASRFNVKLADILSHAASYCQKAAVASLRYPPGVNNDEYWLGVNVISRLVWFVLSVLIIVGEIVNTLLVVPSLFQTTSRLPLPGGVELSSAALFIATPAFFGAVLLECWGLIPHRCGLFPPMGKLSRWVLGITSGVFLVLSILLTGYFYLYRAMYLISVEATQGMSLYILGGLGLLIAAVSVFTLWGLVVGGTGVVSLVLWLAEIGCRIVGSIASFLPQVLDVVALHFGGMSVYQEYGKPATSLVPRMQFARAYQNATALLPQQASLGDAEQDEVVPAEPIALEETMHNPENASLVLVGGFGTKMLPHFARHIRELRATGSIRSQYYLDLSVTYTRAAIDGIVDLSPPYAERQAVLLHEETESQAYRKLLNTLTDKLVETHMDAKVHPAPLLFGIDSAQLAPCSEMLAAISRRLPLHRLVVVTELSSRDMQSTTIQTGIGGMQSLHAEDCIATVIEIGRAHV